MQGLSQLTQPSLDHVLVRDTYDDNQVTMAPLERSPIDSQPTAHAGYGCAVLIWHGLSLTTEQQQAESAEVPQVEEQ